MLEKSLDIIYNKKYLVIVPKMSIDLLESFNYSFGNTILITTDYDDKEFMIRFINQNNFKKIVFVNYQMEYEAIIDSINKKTSIDFIFTESLASFSNEFIYNIYKSIYNLHKKTPNSTLGIVDYSLYESLKNNKENVKRILLDYKINNKKVKIHKNTVGILNTDCDPKYSYFNELSSIKLLEKTTVNVQNIWKTAKEFLKEFGIKYKNYSSIDKILNTSEINLYINFTGNNISLFLRSMDNGIPCILGNSEILDSNDYLKSMLVMKSDDDVNEIAEKIEGARKNKKEILKKYKEFRKKYSEESKKTIEEFLGYKVDKPKERDENEILVTVVVPVYNTEKYLKKSLDSIIAASINNMEVLIINDGSTDNSEKVILKYVRNYPNQIRYIKQENHGLGNVRNVALKEARGKYIASIDSDDTINIDFFESALVYLENDIDVVICDWLTVTNESKFSTPALDWIFDNDNWSKYEGLLYTTIMPSTCNKIIKKELFDELDIKYIEDKYEDLSTNPFILLKAETIKYINKQYYEYYIRSNSIMRTKPGYSMIDIIKIVDERLKKYNEYVNIDINDFKYYTYSWRIEEYVINQLYTIEEKEIKNFIKYIDKNIKEIMEDVFSNKRYQETLEKLSDEEKEYIEKRNKAFKEGKLEKFIKDARKKNDYFKLTPPIIYYGK